MACDLVIAGAGAAGAGAWHECRARGLDTRWIEAKDRTGGRAWTDHTSLGLPFDLGCHWLHTPDRNPFREFAERMRVPFVTEPVRFGFFDGTSFLAAAEAQEGNAAFDRFHATLDAGLVGGKDAAIADLLGTDDPWLPYFTAWSSHELAAETSDVSVLDPTFAVANNADYPIPSGFGALIQRVIAGAPVETGCPARAIDLSARDRLVVETPKGAIEAKAVLLTVSTAVLAREAIRIAPGGWPLDKLRAIDATPLGSSAKIALALDRAALPAELRGAFVICRLEAPRNVAWHFAPHGMDCAIAYMGGAFSRELALAGEAAQADFAIGHLRDMLGPDIARTVTAAVATPFDRDAYIGGGYAYCRAGHGNRRGVLFEPVDGRVFFAGEACSEAFPATAHGAWLTGRAAVARFAEG